MADKHVIDGEYDSTQAVINEFKKNKSIDEIAKNLRMTKVKVQRILITEGLWSSKRSREIGALREQGLTVNEIADRLGKDVRTIQTYLPYSRGQYGNTVTMDSAQSKAYRDRMITAAESMALKEGEAMKEGLDITLKELLRNRVSEKEDANFKRHTEEELRKNPFLSNGSVYRLKFELVNHFIYGAGEDLGMDPEEKQGFLRLAKAEKGLSREVLVPSTMNLHGMHYMIQKLFGWQNSHLHHFCISEQEFDALTGGRVGGWLSLCGSLLHFPNDDSSDFYWDDDYKPEQSVKTWLRRKYTGPYIQKAVCDTYYDSRKEVHGFRTRFPQFEDDMTLEEMNKRIIMEEALNFLTERLTLGELLLRKAPKKGEEQNKAYAAWRRSLEEKKAETDRMIGELSKRKIDSLNEAMEELKGWRANQAHVDRYIYMGMEDEVRQKTGHSAQEWMEDAEYFIAMYERRCKKLFTEYNPRSEPLFDTLYYEYDYGDGWCVKITVLDQYDRKLDADLSGSGGLATEIMNTADRMKCYRYFQDDQEVDEELREVLAYVDVKEAPRCTASDGLNLVDDVGGIYGFMDMLRTLEGDDQEEKRSVKEWARGLGWTGKISKAENLL